MVPRNPTRMSNEDLSYQRKRYTITELLEMRLTLPYVSCPVKNFKPEAWSEKILVKTVPIDDYFDFNTKYTVKVFARRLDHSRRQELLGRQQKQEALDRLVIRKKHQSRGIPPKPTVMPTIPEVLSPATPSTLPRLAVHTTNDNTMRSVSFDTRLSGGYGKKILSAAPIGNGLMTSMHAFVPGGSLKTAPIAVVNAGDNSDWDMKDLREIHKASSITSLDDGFGFTNVSFPISATITTPIILPNDPINVTKRLPAVTKIENLKCGAVVGDVAEAQEEVKISAVKQEAKSVMKTKDRLSLEQPRALMGKRSTSAEQLTWIQIMMSKSIVSASQKAPQVKEALGAVTETLEYNDQFIKAKEVGIFDELYDAKASIISDW